MRDRDKSALLRENLLKLKSKVTDTSCLVQRHVDVIKREQCQAAELRQLRAFKLDAEIRQRAWEEAGQDLHRQLEAAKQAGRRHANEKAKMMLQIADLSSAQKRARDKVMQGDQSDDELQQARTSATAKEARLRSERRQLTTQHLALERKLKSVEQRVQRAEHELAVMERRARDHLEATEQKTEELFEETKQRAQPSEQQLAVPGASGNRTSNKAFQILTMGPRSARAPPLLGVLALAQPACKRARLDTLPQLPQSRTPQQIPQPWSPGNPLSRHLVEALTRGGDAIAVFLEEELAEWVFSACILHPKEWASMANVPLCGTSTVVLSLPPAAEAPLEALESAIGAKGVSWGESLLRALALRLISQGREAPLLPAPLQRLVLLAHVFGRCCRLLEQPIRVRVLAFELARHRRVLEPVLIAALVSAWPAPLKLDRTASAIDSRATSRLNCSPIAIALACLVHRSAAACALRSPAAFGTDTEVALHARCCELLQRCAGAGWRCEDLAALLSEMLADDEDGDESWPARLSDASKVVLLPLPAPLLMPPCGLLLELLLCGASAGGAKPDYFEYHCALELFAAAFGWRWVVAELIHRTIGSLLNDSNSCAAMSEIGREGMPCRETLVQLLKRLIELAPTKDDNDNASQWLHKQLAALANS